MHEDEQIFAFDDIKPVAPVHVLIISKKHITSLKEISKKDEKLLGHIQFVAAKLAKKMKIQDAYRVLIASGEKAGQSVFHLHYHLIGGWKGKAPKMESDPGGLRK